MKDLSVSLKQAIRYQTGVNSGSVVEYYERHFPNKSRQLSIDKTSHNTFMELGFTPNDLILMKKTFLD